MNRTTSKHVRDNRANQLNSTHPTYYLSRGHSKEDATKHVIGSKSLRDNHSRQLNTLDPTNKDPIP